MKVVLALAMGAAALAPNQPQVAGKVAAKAAGAAALGAPTNGSAMELSTAMSTALPGRRASGPGASSLHVARGRGLLWAVLDGAADAVHLHLRARQPRQRHVPRLGEVLRDASRQVPHWSDWPTRLASPSPAGRIRRRARPATAGTGEGPI